MDNQLNLPFQEEREDILSRINIPVGAAFLWMGDPLNPPEGYIFADGSRYPVQAYRALYDSLFRNNQLDYDDRYFELPDLDQTIDSFVVKVIVRI